MNQRLAELMQQEAALIQVPAPRAEDVMASGRGIRRKRRLRTGVAALGVVAVLASGIAGFLSRDDTDADVVKFQGDYGVWGAWADRSTVYVGGQPVPVEGGVLSVKYTSAGVLARLYVERESAGTTTFVLVKPDGAVQHVPVTFGMSTHVATASDQPYLAYSAHTKDGVEIVLYDLATRRVAAHTTLATPEGLRDPISGTPSYVPPTLGLGPGVVWVWFDDWICNKERCGPASTYEWNPGTGSVETGVEWHEDDAFASTRYATTADRQWLVKDRGTDEVLASGDLPKGGRDLQAELAPSGDYLVLREPWTEELSAAIDVETGDQLKIPYVPSPGRATFSPDGRLLVPSYQGSKTEMWSCDLRSGSCQTRSWSPEGRAPVLPEPGYLY